ncbi:hypothetical protein [Paraburkholderia graminis]|uniref:Uncharacterized protein n=1 Tax=Paraburkholderia graminis TaxID=60548 RepID=A0ABD5CFJ8_9BURK|nr:hypothetical protein [Paraburkholderia graminis]
MRIVWSSLTLVFANVLATEHDADSSALEPVWQQLLESPKWHALLYQYPTLRRVRELMVHAENLQSAVIAALY